MSEKYREAYLAKIKEGEERIGGLYYDDSIEEGGKILEIILKYVKRKNVCDIDKLIWDLLAYIEIARYEAA